MAVKAEPVDAPVKDADTDDETKKEAPKMVPLLSLFRFYEKEDLLLLVLGMMFSALGGALFPAVNVAFGNLLDSTAVGDVGGQINSAVVAMEIVAVSLGTSLTLGYWLTSWGAKHAKRVCAKHAGARH
jgi:hypothetical protein